MNENMSHWYSNSFAQFACGVAAGAGVIVFAARAMKFVSGFYAPPQQNTSIDIENEAALSENGRRNSGIAVDRLSTIPDCIMVSPPDMNSNNEKNELVDMLYQIAKDQAHRDCFIHRGITCNICNASPVCGIRFKCANCLDYDVCEVCEPGDHHDRTHVFLKIRCPIPPLANPKAVCLKPFYPGKNVNHISLSWDDIVHLKDKSNFNETEIQTLYEQFKTLAPQSDGITREAFNQCLGTLGRQTNLVMDRMFMFYDQNEDGVISFEEFVHAVSILVKGSQNEKLKYVFDGYDLEKKGYLLYDDFCYMFKAYFHVSIELVRDYIKTCEEEMKASFDETADKPVSSAFHAPIRNDILSSTAGVDIKSLHQLPSNSRSGGSSGARPLIEAMSQDAIDEMVANVFICADVNQDGRITFDEFKTWAVLDNTVLAWFDALGTVF